jgi:hypothetical protein
MQQYSLLKTKLHSPPIRPELVSRPRLIEQLNAGLDPKLDPDTLGATPQPACTTASRFLRQRPVAVQALTHGRGERSDARSPGSGLLARHRARDMAAAQLLIGLGVLALMLIAAAALVHAPSRRR